MQVGEIMHTDVKTAGAEDTFADVAKVMRSNGISSVVVLEGKKLGGIVTERDIVNLVAAGGDLWVHALLFPGWTEGSIKEFNTSYGMQPEVNELKEKYKDDQQKFVQKQMELWKKNKVSPMSGCLPMLVQMPSGSVERSAGGVHFAQVQQPDGFAQRVAVGAEQRQHAGAAHFDFLE